MCQPSVPSINTKAIVEAQKEQLNKNNAVLSNSEVARTTGEKTSKKRTVSSLRVPMKQDTTTTGINTTDTTTGLNIPV